MSSSIYVTQILEKLTKLWEEENKPSKFDVLDYVAEGGHYTNNSNIMVYSDVEETFSTLKFKMKMLTAKGYSDNKADKCIIKFNSMLWDFLIKINQDTAIKRSERPKIEDHYITYEFLFKLPL